MSLRSCICALHMAAAMHAKVMVYFFFPVFALFKLIVWKQRFSRFLSPGNRECKFPIGNANSRFPGARQSENRCFPSFEIAICAPLGSGCCGAMKGLRCKVLGSISENREQIPMSEPKELRIFRFQMWSSSNNLSYPDVRQARADN